MATLTIDGQTVTVDDSFLKLSPEQQNATVEDIAASLPRGGRASAAAPTGLARAAGAEGRIPEAPAGRPYSGFILPFSRDEQGNVSFDSNAGLVGMAKRLPGDIMDALTLPREIVQGSAPDPHSPEAVSRAMGFAALASPLARVPAQAAAAAPVVQPMAAAAPAAFANDALSQAARLGVELPRFAASESPAVQAIGQASRQLPLAGGIVERAAGKLTGDLAAKAGEIGASLTENAGLDKAALGNQLRDALSSAAGNITETNHRAYTGVRAAIEPNKPVKAALEPIQNTLADVMARRVEAGETGLGNLQPVANLLQRPQGPSFEGLQRARSRLSKAIDFDARMGGGMEQGDLKQVYGALTDAMERAVQGSAKGDAQAAVGTWRAADQSFAESMGNMRSLSQALRSPSDEAIVNQVIGMAGEKTGNARRLVQLSQDIGPENMRTLGAHVLDQAGGPQWSAARFSTTIDKLSNTAKRVLFGPARQQVEDLHALATRWASQEAKFANRSNTGRAALLGGYGAAVAGTAMVNPLLAVGKVLAGVGGGITLGKVLSQPVTARAVVQTARAYERMAQNPTLANRNAYFALQRLLTTAVANEVGRGAAEQTPTK